MYTVRSLVMVRNQLPAQVVNLEIATFSQFQVYLNATQANDKFITS